MALAVGITSALYAQVQRRVLVEQFTQASCGPCAVTNPGFNALLDANETKVTQIKYQTSWPGVDPMNAHNPTQVATRVGYYNVSGVPDCAVGGNDYNGHPGSVTQSTIDGAYNSVMSPMEVKVSHIISNDTVFVHAVFTALQPVTGTLKGHVVITERAIIFANAPGSNGEKEFFGVMKKMLPSDQGTSLGASMNAGDSIVVDAFWKMANVYNTAEIGVVAFAQNDVDKYVYQSEYSEPLPLALDAKAIDLAGLGYTCNTSVSPVLTVENTGATTITSIDYEYKVGNGAAVPQAWAGSLAPGATVTLNLPAVTVANGKNTLSATIKNINGVIDPNAFGNTFAGNIYAFTNPSVMTPVVQGFTAVAMPSDWTVDNPDNNQTWTRVASNAYGAQGTGSTRIDFYNITAGGIDYLVSPKFDLSGLTAPVGLNFDMAHKRYSAQYTDQLDIMISTDCGTTWNLIWSKSGAQLATTTGFTTAAYAPVAADWKAQSINLDSYIGQPNVLVSFKGLSGYGNNLFLDNINVAQGLSINDNALNNSISISPNPSNNGLFTLNFDLDKSTISEISVFDAQGKEVMNFELKRNLNGNFLLDLSNQAAGLYRISLNVDGKLATKQVSIVK